MPIQRTIIDTGIFQIEELSVGDNLAEFVSALGREVKAALSWDPLQQARDDANRILTDAGLPVAQRGSSDAREPVVNDAISLLETLDHLDQLPLAELDPGELLGRGYQIGHLRLQLMVRSFERHVRDGKQQSEARRKGGKRRAESFQPSPEQVDGWRAEVDAKRQSNPMLSRTEAIRQVAKNAGTSFYQVKKALGRGTDKLSVEC